MNTVPAVQNNADVMASVILKGDLSRLSPDEKVKYYVSVCRSLGLNPLTQPFAYMTLSGKHILYAKRDATDQLRSLHNISIEDMTEIVHDGVYIVTCKVRNGKNRTDMSRGAVSITGLKGDALANAMMKAETKAKRRATLSIVGLGMLDETEIDTIPGAVQMPPLELPPDEQIDDTGFDDETGEIDPGPPKTRPESEIIADLDASLGIAAKSGMTALKEKWEELEPKYQDALRSAANGRHTATAREADMQRAKTKGAIA